jgi:hypothetical protein
MREGDKAMSADSTSRLRMVWLGLLGFLLGAIGLVGCCVTAVVVSLTDYSEEVATYASLCGWIAYVILGIGLVLLCAFIILNLHKYKGQ